MIKGQTKSGFEFEIDEQRLNNMEFIDLLVELDTVDENNASAILTTVSKLISCILDKDTKKRLYDHIRDDKGTVPIEKVQEEVNDIIRFNGNEELKNV